MFNKVQLKPPKDSPTKWSYFLICSGAIRFALVQGVILALILPVSASAAPGGCSEAAPSIQVQSEDSETAYYGVSTTVSPDGNAKMEEAERVILEIDARIAAEGVDQDGVPRRQELPLHLQLAGFRYGSYSRSVRGEIKGPRVNRRVLGMTIQRVSCRWQDPSDETEDSSVNERDTGSGG